MARYLQSYILILALFLPAFIFSENVCDAEFSCGYYPEKKEDVENIPLSPSSYIQHRGLPSSVDLSSIMPPPGSQGGQGSCVAWSTTYATKSYHEKRKQKWEYDPTFQNGKGEHVFSPAFTYNQINGGKDAGSSIKTAFDLIVRTGAVPWSVMPYSDKDYLTQPSPEAKMLARKFRAKSYAQLRLDNLDAMKAELAKVNPIVAGFKVYPELRSVKGDVMDSYSGDVKGGHAMAIVGYDDSKRSPKGHRGAFLIQNSWGKKWGNGGFGWISYDIMLDLVKYAYVLYDSEGEVTHDTKISPPQSVTASRGTYNDKIVLKWSDVNGATAYEVERKDPEGEFQSIGYANTASYSDTVVEAGIEYSYRIIASNADTKSTPSDSPVATGFAAAAKTRPSPVTNLEASVSQKTVTLTWDASEGAKNYIVSRSENGNWKVLTQGSSTSFTDRSAPAGRISYSVIAKSDGGKSDASIVYADIASPGNPPAKVEELSASEGLYGDRIELNWRASDSASLYFIYRYDYETKSFGGPFESKTNSFADSDSSLEKGKSYAYTVLAANQYGYSEYSAYATGSLHPTARAGEAPAPPSELKGSITQNQQVELSWKTVKGVRVYNVFRKLSGTKEFKFVTKVEGTQFKEPFPGKSGELYFYTVRSQSELAGESVDSISVAIFKNSERAKSRSIIPDESQKFTGEYKGQLWNGANSMPLTVNISKEKDTLIIKVKEGNTEKQYQAKNVYGSSSLETSGFTFTLDKSGRSARISTASYDETVRRSSK